MHSAQSKCLKHTDLSPLCLKNYDIKGSHYLQCGSAGHALTKIPPWIPMAQKKLWHNQIELMYEMPLNQIMELQSHLEKKIQTERMNSFPDTYNYTSTDASDFLWMCLQHAWTRTFIVGIWCITFPFEKWDAQGNEWVEEAYPHSHPFKCKIRDHVR